MRGHFENPIKGQFLIDQVEEITPIPGVIFDYPMGVQLDPQIEDKEGHAADPTKGRHKD